ncbi:MAG TPA: ATP-binding protein [Chloroflexota bacterium]
MDNPFRYGSVVSGVQFVGRKRELAELEIDLRSGQNVVLFAPRRYGKTSLVLAVAEQLRAQGVLVAYYDMIGAPSKIMLANGLATAMYRDLVGVRDRAWRRVGDFFAKRSFSIKISIGPEGTPAVDLGLAERPRDVDYALQRLLEIPQQVARDGHRVVVILDEFQEAPGLDAHLPGEIRSVWQMQRDVSHVFLGSKRHMMTRIFTDINEPMYRMAKSIVLGPIDRDSLVAFIRGRFSATEQRIEDAGVDRILEITECHPYDTQQLCHFAWNLAILEKAVVTPVLVDRAVMEVLAADNARYTELWSRLTTHQRRVLAALVASGGTTSIYSEGYRREYALGAASSVQRSTRALQEQGLVDEVSPGEYQVPENFLRVWISLITTAAGYSRPLGVSEAPPRSRQGKKA